MSKLANLTYERLRRTLAELRRTRAAHADEVRKSQLKRSLSKLTRERRQRETGRTSPRLTVVTK